jgi:hypothetical protein
VSERNGTNPAIAVDDMQAGVARLGALRTIAGVVVATVAGLVGVGLWIASVRDSYATRPWVTEHVAQGPAVWSRDVRVEHDAPIRDLEQRARDVETRQQINMRRLDTLDAQWERMDTKLDRILSAVGRRDR